MARPLPKGLKERTRKINRQTLIREVADKLDLYKTDVSLIYSTLEELVKEHLLETDEDEDMCIDLFQGIQIYSAFVPEHIHIHSVTQEEHLVKDKLKFGTRMTQYYKKRMVKEFRDRRDLLENWRNEHDEDTKEWE